MKQFVAIALLCVTSAPLLAGTAYADAPAAAATSYNTTDTDLGTLLDNATTKAILQKYIPDLLANPQIDMARSMTLKQVQSYAPDKLTNDTLAKIDADLAKVPASK